MQLADTRKLLSATKTTEATASKDVEVACPAKEVMSEAKINNLMQAELNQNELKVLFEFGDSQEKIYL